MPLVAKTLRIGIRNGGKHPNLFDSDPRLHSRIPSDSVEFQALAGAENRPKAHDMHQNVHQKQAFAGNRRKTGAIPPYPCL
jgi:hypothetical protein